MKHADNRNRGIAMTPEDDLRTYTIDFAGVLVDADPKMLERIAEFFEREAPGPGESVLQVHLEDRARGRRCAKRSGGSAEE